MKLKEYLDATGIKQTFLAKKSGISKASINVYALGKKVPSIEVALKIEKATDGHVRLYDWLDESDVNESHEIHNDKKKHSKKTPLKN